MKQWFYLFDFNYVYIILIVSSVFHSFINLFFCILSFLKLSTCLCYKIWFDIYPGKLCRLSEYFSINFYWNVFKIFLREQVDLLKSHIDFKSMPFFIRYHNNPRIRGCRLEVFYSKGILRTFAQFTGKLKKRLWHRCFPVNFAIFLRTPFLSEHLRWLLLQISTTGKHTKTVCWLWWK